MSQTVCLDLRHLDLPGAIAAYALLGSEVTVVDPGPATTFPHLVEGLERLGVGPRDLRHVALTHVHLDHAGATGDLVAAFPDVRVHVHAEGAPHMVDPSRLVARPRQVYLGADTRDFVPIPNRG